jgi:type IX secretion system substrate protein/cytochrome c554/c'-like protein
MKKVVTTIGLVAALFVLIGLSTSQAQTYVGSDKCKMCHDNVNANTGYNIWEEYTKSGHPYKFNLINGAAPTYPDNTSPGVPNPPPGTSWDDYAGVIGGYGWKARFVKKDGKIFTATQEVQYNLQTSGWVAYHFEEDKAYNQACFVCHTTGSDPDGTWVPETPGLGTFSEGGIRCEGCHGPGSDHMANPGSVKLPNTGDVLRHERCGDCHQRGGRTNAIPASGGYIKHHEQFNEMMASKHGQGSMKCGTCHDAHIAGRYPHAAGAGLSAITKTCETCHSDHAIKIDGQDKNINCTDCHMSMASKSAVGTQKGNGWEGDVPTHIWAINTDPVTKDAMFSPDGAFVALDGDGRAAVTLDFACLSCHQNQTVEWASSYAKEIHTKGITTGIAAHGMPTSFELQQNFPNPFNPSTKISYQVPSRTHVRLEVMNIQGEIVATLVNGMTNPGTHQVEFNGNGHSSGMYFYRLAADGQTLAKKMLLTK